MEKINTITSAVVATTPGIVAKVISLFKPKAIHNLRLLYDKGKERVLIKYGTINGKFVTLSQIGNRVYLTDSTYENVLYSSSNLRRLEKEAKDRFNIVWI